LLGINIAKYLGLLHKYSNLLSRFKPIQEHVYGSFSPIFKIQKATLVEICSHFAYLYLDLIYNISIIIIPITIEYRESLSFLLPLNIGISPSLKETKEIFK
jgi:hypothetical protein